MPVHDILTKAQFQADTAITGALRSSADLIAIENELDAYHLVQKTDIEARIPHLNRILVLCGQYITTTEGQYRIAHPHRYWRKPGVERLRDQAQAKLNYLADVLGIERTQSDLLIIPLDRLTPAQRFKRLALAVRRFDDPTLARTLRHQYWGEIIDPLHRPLNKPENQGLYDQWLNERYGVVPTTNHSFYRWLEGQDVLGMSFSQYLDEDQRRNYQVLPQGDGSLTRDVEGNDNADTTENSTNFSGRGWGIFVLSRNGMLYAGTHINSQTGFYHSCFLSGAPVLAAGELKLRAGQFHAVSPKSGHYQPGIPEMVSLLNWMQVNHVPLAGSKVQWFAKDANGRLIIIHNCTKIEWYDAPQFLAANGALNALVPLRIEMADNRSLTTRIIYDPNIGADSNDLRNYVATFRVPNYVDWLA